MKIINWESKYFSVGILRGLWVLITTFLLGQEIFGIFIFFSNLEIISSLIYGVQLNKTLVGITKKSNKNNIYEPIATVISIALSTSLYYQNNDILKLKIIYIFLIFALISITNIFSGKIKSRLLTYKPEILLRYDSYIVLWKYLLSFLFFLLIFKYGFSDFTFGLSFTIITSIGTLLINFYYIKILNSYKFRKDIEATYVFIKDNEEVNNRELISPVVTGLSNSISNKIFRIASATFLPISFLPIVALADRLVLIIREAVSAKIYSPSINQFKIDGNIYLNKLVVKSLKNYLRIALFVIVALSIISFIEIPLLIKIQNIFDYKFLYIFSLLSLISIANIIVLPFYGIILKLNKLIYSEIIAALALFSSLIFVYNVNILKLEFFNFFLFFSIYQLTVHIIFIILCIFATKRIFNKLKTNCH